MNLNQVTIYSEKPVETVEFFEKLGLTRIVDSLPRYARLECPDGESTLSVSKAETRPVGSVPNDSITLYFECEDLDAEHARLTALGLEFDQDPTDQPWLWREASINSPASSWAGTPMAGRNSILQC